MRRADLSRPTLAPAGVVFEGDGPFHTTDYAPAQGLERFIHGYWTLSWDLPAGEAFPLRVIPSGCINILIQEHTSRVAGVRRKIYEFTLKENGDIFGVLFKPGAFRLFSSAQLSELTDRAAPIREIFGDDGQALERRIFSTPLERDRQEIADRFFLDRLPPEDPAFSTVEKAVGWILEDPQIRKVDDIVSKCALGKRTLQRLFDEYLGINPKWMIQTARFQEAVKTLGLGAGTNWAEFALSLGYYDQSHFINDFKAIIGYAPDAASSRLKTEISR